MVEEKLSITDRKVIREEIKASYVVGIAFLIFGAFILFIFFGASLMHINISHIFIVRAVSIYGIYFLVTLFVWVSYYQHYMDLIKGAKIKVELNTYELVVKKKRTYLVSEEWKHEQHLEIDESILPHIDTLKPLKLELGKRSHVILFISHDAENYLNRKD
ncbi:MAG: hypothetical protein ACXVPN_00545 [Bacteroidia bacterium]